MNRGPRPDLAGAGAPVGRSVEEIDTQGARTTGSTPSPRLGDVNVGSRRLRAARGG